MSNLAKQIKSALGTLEKRPERTAEVPFHRLAPSPVPTGPHRKAPPRKVRPPRPVDELVRFWPARPETLAAAYASRRSGEDLLDVAAFETGYIPAERHIRSLVKPAQPPPRGPAEIIARLAKRSITLHATADGAFYVESEGGGLDEGTRDAIAAAAPLLRPFLHGTPRRCALPNHVGSEPPEAVTLTLGGAAWCGACSS